MTAPTGTPSATATKSATPPSTAGRPRPKRHGPELSRHPGPDAGAPALPAQGALAEEDEAPSTTKMSEKAHAAGVVEADAELGVDLSGQGAETQDLEGTELGQHYQGNQHRSPRMANRAWPTVTRQKVRNRPKPRLRATSSWPGRRCAGWPPPAGRPADRRPRS